MRRKLKIDNSRIIILLIHNETILFIRKKLAEEVSNSIHAFYILEVSNPKTTIPDIFLKILTDRGHESSEWV